MNKDEIISELKAQRQRLVDGDWKKGTPRMAHCACLVAWNSNALNASICYLPDPPKWDVDKAVEELTNGAFIEAISYNDGIGPRLGKNAVTNYQPIQNKAQAIAVLTYTIYRVEEDWA